ncbi:MAG: hypothetical protein JWO60_402, partial [Frankiales bacterium]|nr:hypothetical protein [Frankiales bacterium]
MSEPPLYTLQGYELPRPGRRARALGRHVALGGGGLT